MAESSSFMHNGHFNIISTGSILVHDMTTTILFQKSSVFYHTPVYVCHGMTAGLLWSHFIIKHIFSLDVLPTRHTEQELYSISSILVGYCSQEHTNRTCISA